MKALIEWKFHSNLSEKTRYGSRNYSRMLQASIVYALWKKNPWNAQLAVLNVNMLRNFRYLNCHYARLTMPTLIRIFYNDPQNR